MDYFKSKNHEKISFISLFSLHYSFTNAQAYIYHPFSYSNVIWRFQEYDLCSINPPTVWYLDYQFRFDGDTVISGKNYKKLFKDKRDNACFGSGTSFTTEYSGGIRNDTINKRIYFFEVSNSAETLIYDFKLNVGDSTLFCPGVVASIDSVLVGSAYRKRFVTDYSDEIIEGIGSTGSGGFSDLILPFCGPSLSPNTKFICYSNNTDFYPDPSSSCPLISVNIREQKTESANYLQISPNPVIDLSIIELQNEILNQVIIYNSLGVIVKEYKNDGANKFYIRA